MDLTGVPRSNGQDLVEFKPLLWAKVMSTTPGILMLDDALDVQRPDLFSCMYRISLERRIGYLSLDRGVQVVCASNTPEESTLSQMIPAPLANRMVIHEIERPTVDEWANWMRATYGDGWNKKTLAFLKRFEGEGFLLQLPKETEVLRNYPSPRTWTKTALELQHNEPDPEILDGLLGPEVGQKFHAFCQVDVDVKELIEEPELWREQTLDAKYMLCLELATWFKEADEPEKGFGLLDRMKEESRQFPILTFLSLDWKKLSELLNTLFRDKPNYSELVSQAIEDREKISV